MASTLRKTIVKITDEGRDFGKTFIVCEMPAFQAESWANRALVLLAQSGGDIGPIQEGGGWAAIAGAAMQALPTLDYRGAEPLFDEMAQYFRYQPNPSHSELARPIVRGDDEVDGDIMEVNTIRLLRRAFMELHTGFFGKGAPSKA